MIPRPVPVESGSWTESRQWLPGAGGGLGGVGEECVLTETGFLSGKMKVF